MAKKGWIKLHRCIQEHWLWENKPFSYGQAFIDMLMKANHEDNKILFNGKLLDVNRGSFITSMRKLANEWGWSIGKVDRFFKLLEKDKMVIVKQNTHSTTITIENYASFQDVQNTDGTPIDTQTEHRRNTGGNKQECKEYKELKNNNNIYSANAHTNAQANALFEHLWQLYPNKKGKARISDTTKKKLLDIGEEEMTRAIERYQKDLKKDSDWRKPQNGSTFFGGGYVDYLDKNYAVPIKSTPSNIAEEFLAEVEGRL